MSRLDDIVASMEAGDEINWSKERDLVTLDAIRDMERLGEEAAQRERAADDILAERLGVDPAAIP